jgi:hypothetical protein
MRAACIGRSDYVRRRTDAEDMRLYMVSPEHISSAL